ncbi:unnamed protein product [Mytilus edulis]|uniref:Tyr recombinase domain-containing protein n=1 Tax=Mytilus edulis TaxID=6550 RepID=A0A8S3SR39_MYTED|nr:unnamed protein product [Mytilus edulis]
MVKSVEKEAISGHLKNRAVRGRDDKAFMVKKDDFNAFCSPPKLDDNIEEGLPIGHKGNSFKSGVNIPPFHRELDNDFRRMDNSARALFRAVSYGTMISAFLDEATCEDDRIEGRKALINCFRSMADLSGRIMANSVLSRRKLFLKNVNFISKSTEKKLLKLPVFGSQLFNGKYFDTLHTSAENLRDARETQNVYNNTGSYSKNFNKSRDDRTPVNDFNRKRKGDYSENSESGAKVARTNTYSNKDNFRPGNFSRKGKLFSGKQLGAQKVSQLQGNKFKEPCTNCKYKSPEASKDSIARWIVNTVRYAYENADKDTLKTVRAHDTRRLSTSWALFCGVSAEEILKAAHWTSETTFTSFYLKDVPDHQSIFAKSAILDSFKRGRQK